MSSPGIGQGWGSSLPVPRGGSVVGGGETVVAARVPAGHDEAPEPGGSRRPVDVSLLVEPGAQPGGVVLATVRARAHRDVVLQGGEVTLACATAYRYTTGGFFGATYSSTARRSTDVATQALPGPTLLRAGEERRDQVLLGLPTGATPSVRCDLVTIRWQVGAEVRFEGTGRARAEEVPVTVVGPGSGAETGGPTVVPLGRAGTVGVEGLGARALSPGATLSGGLVVRARRAESVESVRADLVLTQRVPHGPMIGDDPSRNPYIAEKEAEEVVVRSELGAPERAADGLLRAGFRLDAPSSLPAPTLVTADFSLRWVLRAAVRRRVAGLRLTSTADLELDATTVPRP